MENLEGVRIVTKVSYKDNPEEESEKNNEKKERRGGKRRIGGPSFSVLRWLFLPFLFRIYFLGWVTRAGEKDRGDQPPSRLQSSSLCIIFIPVRPHPIVMRERWGERLRDSPCCSNLNTLLHPRHQPSIALLQAKSTFAGARRAWQTLNGIEWCNAGQGCAWVQGGGGWNLGGRNRVPTANYPSFLLTMVVSKGSLDGKRPFLCRFSCKPILCPTTQKVNLVWEERRVPEGRSGVQGRGILRL